MTKVEVEFKFKNKKEAVEFLDFLIDGDVVFTVKKFNKMEFRK